MNHFLTHSSSPLSFEYKNTDLKSGFYNLRTQKSDRDRTTPELELPSSELNEKSTFGV